MNAEFTVPWKLIKSGIMGRGVSSGGGQSSLGYLFGDGEAPAPKPAANSNEGSQNQGPVASNNPSQKPAAATAMPPAEINKEIPAGVRGNTPNNANNYFRADGQNTGNFITERPSTKVHTAPGGGSSLDYLFGGGSK